MKSRKKKQLPVRAKRYQQKRNENFEYNNLEPRQLLAADFLSTLNFVGDTDLINLTEPVAVTESVELLRNRLNLGHNESVKLQQATTDSLGFQHLKYQQYFNNVLIEGSNYTLHLRDSQIVSMSGDRVGVIDAVEQIDLASNEALAFAMDYIGAEQYAWQNAEIADLFDLHDAPDGELVYISDSNGTSIPTYKFDMYTLDLGTRDYVYVNANSGEIETSISRIMNADVPATGFSHYNGNVSFTADEVSTTEFRLQQVTEGVQTFDNQMGGIGDFSNAIDIVSTSTNFDQPEQTSGVSAHWGAENTLAMLQSEFGRNSFDDNGTTLVSYVNVSNGLVNAFWNGSAMQYGEGDGVNYGPLVALDVVGHEIAHGVTEFSANLVYRNEPGALNESFSDIFGEYVENYASGSNDWVLGADFALNGIPFRSFIDPNAHDQPDTYLGDLWFTQAWDNGGVHFNSGVQNKWFYILSVGEAGVNDNGDSYDVTGIGMDAAAQIAYRNLTTYLGVNSQYQDARDGAVQAAIDIFGQGSDEHLATDDAWAAVGLYSDNIRIDSVKEIVPGSMIYTTEVGAAVEADFPSVFTINLNADQTLSLIADASGGMAPLVTVYAPDSTVLAAVGSLSSRTAIDLVPVDTAGQYRIEVASNNGVGGNINLRVVLNASLESELVLGLSNGDLADAQDISNSAIPFDAISADRLGVFGDFEISEIASFVNEDFESGALDGSWSTNSTDVGGRIQVRNDFGAGEGDYALFMHTINSGFENQNEAIWTVDLSTRESTFLNFYHASFNDENAELPVSYNGTTEGDGVSVSQDGLTWYTVLTDSVTSYGNWRQFSVDLGQFADSAGIELTSNFKIKFQQYDDDILGSDGRGYDGISLTESSNSEDWYAVDLQGGEVASLAVGKTSLTGYVNLELLDSNGNVVATGTPGEGIASRINQFTAAATDTYFARLVGSVTPYGFVVTRGTDFDTGSSMTMPQDVNLPESVIGHIETTTVTTADPDAAQDKSVLDNFFPGVTLSNNVTGGSVYAVRASFDAPTGLNVFGPTKLGASGWRAFADELRADFDVNQTRVSIYVGAEEVGEDVGFLRAYDSDNKLIAESLSGPVAPGEIRLITVISASRQIAYVVAGGLQNDVTPLDGLIYEIEKDTADVYSFNAAAGELLTANASFPGGGRFLPGNTLVSTDGTINLRLELVNAAGAVVATGTDSLEYYSENAGTYRVRVTADNAEGNYALDFNSEVQLDRFQLGSNGLGIAVDDNVQGVGYLMYSVEKLATRFAANPPFVSTAERVIAVRFDSASQSWQYNNNYDWFNFTPTEGDRLLARVNFTTDQAFSLEGLSGIVHGIRQGFATSDMTFKADSWNSKPNDGEFEVTGTHFYTGDQWVDVGAANFGIASDDVFTGNGFMMYSEQTVQSRFAANPPYSVASTNLITVRHNGTSWQYHNNTAWFDFTPVGSDRLIASINFGTDEVIVLTSQSGNVMGIDSGVISTDLAFIANQWAGKSNDGEFEFTGTKFIGNKTRFAIGDPATGVRVQDNATGTGYIMYSSENVFTRFAAAQPNADNSTNMIAVRWNAGASSWQYNDDTAWINFAHVATDRLIAAVDFDADTIAGIEGMGGRVGGILQGFFDSDLTFEANRTSTGANNGEFFVNGTFFKTSAYSKLIGPQSLGIAVDDAATGTGYLMYSETNLKTRFAGNPPFVFTASKIIAVRYFGGNWQYNDNSNWHTFMRMENDRLLAAVDFDNDTVTSLAGMSGNVNGIALGFYDGDLTFVADSWAGSANDGEFQVFGTSFIV